MRHNLDREIISKVKDLSMVFTDEPQSNLLVKIPNNYIGTDLNVTVETREFTSLCPLNMSQPDFTDLVIGYKPALYCVELKSLKFYLVSFRQVPIFHEQVPSRILNDLVELLKPKRMIVVGKFTTRGGIDTTVEARYPAED